MSDAYLEADLSKLGGVTFAFPSYDGKVIVEQLGAIYYCSQQLASAGIKSNLIYEKSNALIDYSRNRLVHKFLNDTKCQKLVFIDTDIVFKWEDLERLLTFSSKFPIVVGTYCAKQDVPKFFINPVYDEHGKVVVNEELGLVSVSGVGAGFTIIDRSVFETMQPVTPTFTVHDEVHHQYFATGIVDGHYFGEDIWFFNRWVKEFGGQVWLDPAISLKHVGTKTYDHNFASFYFNFIEQAEQQQVARSASKRLESI